MCVVVCMCVWHICVVSIHRGTSTFTLKCVCVCVSMLMPLCTLCINMLYGSCIFVCRQQVHVRVRVREVYVLPELLVRCGMWRCSGDHKEGTCHRSADMEDSSQSDSDGSVCTYVCAYVCADVCVMCADVCACV